MSENKVKRSLVALLVLVLITLGYMPFVDSQSVADSPVIIDVTTVNADGQGYTFLSNKVTIVSDGVYTLTGSTTTTCVVITGSVIADITLDNVSINIALSPLTIMSGASVNLILEGDNLLQAAGSRCGVALQSNTYLTIGGDGSLTATGGTNSGAGIGAIASNNIYDYHITINSGIITASGFTDGAGIGGNYRSKFGYITINGGTVVAIASPSGATYGSAIGGSDTANAGNITINGGKVTAISASTQKGCAIGGGRNPSAIPSNIKITGGEVTAICTPGSIGAAIGSSPSNAYDDTICNIEISGGKVVAISGENTTSSMASATIGAGYAERGRVNVNISGGTVYATNANASADAIGAGTTYAATMMASVVIDGGSVRADRVRSPKNSTGEEVYCSTLMFAGLAAANWKIPTASIDGVIGAITPDAGGSIYGTKDIYTDDSAKFYPWLKHTDGASMPLWCQVGTKVYTGLFDRPQANATHILHEAKLTAQVVGLDNLLVGKKVSGAKLTIDLEEAKYLDSISLDDIDIAGLPAGLSIREPATSTSANRLGTHGIALPGDNSMTIDIYGTPTTANKNSQPLEITLSDRAFWGGIAPLRVGNSVRAGAVADTTQGPGIEPGQGNGLENSGNSLANTGDSVLLTVAILIGLLMAVLVGIFIRRREKN